ncbi:unnamed protein product [Clavelina lepadiformis]|uniref:Uncharacterized protein n=1 Tax=Clavelina lepadiformis TaxID=159417 RepID=A0ABP0EV45_CLALP
MEDQSKKTHQILHSTASSSSFSDMEPIPESEHDVSDASESPTPAHTTPVSSQPPSASQTPNVNGKERRRSIIKMRILTCIEVDIDYILIITCNRRVLGSREKGVGTRRNTSLHLFVVAMSSFM